MASSGLFFTILYQPLFNALIFLYNSLGGDLGLAVIVLTAILRLALWPWYQSNSRSQRAMTKVQSLVSDIQKQYKGDQPKQTQEMMRIYKENKIQPFGMILFMVVQFILLWGMFKIFQGVFDGKMFAWLYPFVQQPEVLNNMFLGFLDLSKPYIAMAVIVTVFQFLQTKISLSNNQVKDKTAKMTQNITLYVMPILIFVIYLKLPSILALYWMVMSLIGFVQELLVKKQFEKETLKLKA